MIWKEHDVQTDLSHSLALVNVDCGGLNDCALPQYPHLQNEGVRTLKNSEKQIRQHVEGVQHNM